MLGDREPEGRLPASFPESVGQIPVHHDRLPSGRPSADGFSNGYQVGYRDRSFLPRFAFGHGLSYTTFAYGAPSVDRPALWQEGEGADAAVTVSVAVANTGPRTGTTLVQLYLRDLVASVSRPLLSFRGFERVRLAPGQTRRVSFRIDEPMLRFHDDRMRFVSEPGDFHAFVGPSAARLSDPVAFTLRAGRPDRAAGGAR